MVVAQVKAAPNSAATCHLASLSSYSVSGTPSNRSSVSILAGATKARRFKLFILDVVKKQAKLEPFVQGVESASDDPTLPSYPARLVTDGEVDLDSMCGIKYDTVCQNRGLQFSLCRFGLIAYRVPSGTGTGIGTIRY